MFANPPRKVEMLFPLGFLRGSLVLVVVGFVGGLGLLDLLLFAIELRGVGGDPVADAFDFFAGRFGVFSGGTHGLECRLDL